MVPVVVVVAEGAECGELPEPRDAMDQPGPEREKGCSDPEMCGQRGAPGSRDMRFRLSGVRFAAVCVRVGWVLLGLDGADARGTG